MSRKLLIGAVAAAFASVGTMASATVYNLNVYQTGFTGNLGTVTVTGEGTSILSFDINLQPGVFFQAKGGGNSDDAFFFSLTGLNGSALTYNFLTPAGGNAPGSMTFTGLQAGSYGQGFAKPFTYAVDDADPTNPINYYGGELKFTVTNTGGGLNLAPVNTSSGTIYGGADLRTTINGATVTGPVGLSRVAGPVPEPGSWALMIVGLGATGAMLRRRRALAAVPA
jgi:hypothetical protein